MDLGNIIKQMNADGAFNSISSNPFAQFGTNVRRYVGAEILPERLVLENAYREDLVRYRTVIANDAPRYSPAQRKGGADFAGQFLVELGTQDILVEFTGREYDQIVQMSLKGDGMDVASYIAQLVDLKVNRALIEKTELQRWQALVDAEVVRTGQNGYTETVSYEDPSGHRAAAGGDWSDDNYDPMDDILSMHQLLASKGYVTSRILTSTSVVSTLAKNSKISARTGTLQVVGGSLVAAGGFATLNSINQMLQSNGIPVIETYDVTYRDEAGTLARFMPETGMLFVAQGGQDPVSFTFEDETRVVSNPLGYTAVGRASGQSEAGRVINVEQFNNKPPRVVAEGYQESLPVITEPEAIAVINEIDLGGD